MALDEHSADRRRWYSSPVAWAVAFALAAVAVVVVLAVTGDEDAVVVAGAAGARFEDVREGDRVRVEGTVREADYATETGDLDGIAFETENAIFADSVTPAPDADLEGADLDFGGPGLRGERVTVVGEVDEVDADARAFVLELE